MWKPFSTGTFDVQDVVIREKSSRQYEITCYFASGSEVKGCRIVIISERRDCELHTTATRQEGAGDAVVNVTLPTGEYSVVVYDDELVTAENPAFNTTLSVPGILDSVSGETVIAVNVMQTTSRYTFIHTGCVFKMEDETTRGREGGLSFSFFCILLISNFFQNQ